MLVRRWFRILTLVMLSGALGVAGCSRDHGTAPAQFPTEGDVFLDQFGSGVTFQAFLGSKLDAVDIDLTQTQAGTASLNVIVPDSGDPSGSYAGGAFTTTIGRNLSGFDALTFWAKASRTVTLNVVGIGNDNTGTSTYTAEMNNLELTTTWTKFVLPIPLPEKLTAEQGMFYFAEGPEGGAGCQIWFDEIKYEALGTVTSPSADLGTSSRTLEVGEVDTLGYVDVSLNVNGLPHELRAMPGYLTFTSSNTSAVTAGDFGVITGVGQGAAELTAKLGAVDASGSISVTVSAADAAPTVAAPTPTAAAADVISLYSDAYTDVAVTTWSAEWDMADVSDETVASDNVKKYSNLAFAGIEFTTPTIDASAMTRFHLDIWTPNSTAAPAEFKIKLVDFGANGVFGGGDDKEQEISFSATTAPALATGTWVSIDLPLVSFSGLTTRAHLAQLILSSDQLSTIYIDNIYFYDAGEPTVPTIPAPIPTENASDVISLLSSIYTNVPVDTWSAVWDAADVANFTIGTDSMKQYTNFNYAGIEFRTSPINANTMTHFHMDLWTPDPTGSPVVFKVKLVDFGADGALGGGDDLYDELSFDHTIMRTGVWVSIDVPLSSFVDLLTKDHLGQLVLTAPSLNTVFIDNIYFYDSGLPTAPTTPAPAPSQPAADVVSLYSDVYTDVAIDTWSAPWDSADVATYMVGSDSTKRYSNLLFAGIEFKNTTIDASTMTHFHMDLWTPDPTDAPAIFKIKLVDFGADGAWSGGDDVEHELTLDESTMNTGTWVAIDLPLGNFTNLTTRAHLAQLIISGDPNTVYIDNVYFHK